MMNKPLLLALLLLLLSGCEDNNANPLYLVPGSDKPLESSEAEREKIKNLLDECFNLPDQPNAPTLANTHWQLVSLNGEKSFGDITLEFKEEKFSGNNNCNRYNSVYFLQGNELKFACIAQTGRACIGSDDYITEIMEMEQDSHYLDLLSKVHSFQLADDNQLYLDTPDNEQLVYHRIEPEPAPKETDSVYTEEVIEINGGESVIKFTPKNNESSTGSANELSGLINHK